MGRRTVSPSNPLDAGAEGHESAAAVALNGNRMSRSAWWRALDQRPVLGLGVVLFVLPFIIPERTLATQILTMGLFATSFNLLLGYTGLLSFGHSTFFGLGAYAVGISLIRYTHDFWVVVALGLLVTTVAAAVIGWFCLRRREVYFAMLTLAFNQLVYFVAFQAKSLTGGDNGLGGIPLARFELPGIFRNGMDQLHHSYFFYYVVYVLVILSLLSIHRIIQSPLGHGLQAIRESEERAEACGYDTNRIQLMSFVFAGFFAGLAGALNAMFYGFVPLDNLNWFLAGIVVIMTILGGRGTFVGPFIGAAIYLALQEYLSRATSSWLLITGAIFVVLVLLLPQGIWGTIKAVLTGETRVIRRPWERAAMELSTGDLESGLRNDQSA